MLHIRVTMVQSVLVIDASGIPSVVRDAGKQVS